ncbi:acyltransferase [Rhizobium sp. Leaf371]|uniref:apolipoprotein N-acyltransferase n=1 Tax=Rhizobium sp. Leaf371 TaxID=1736355 RepID=UPI00071509D7|nr:apolipoprotein N-acyltransferase [Rhizobium sp. Leaf371]KQS65308.1 acyltransferase [Rhizobium sp. Leaf371]
MERLAGRVMLSSGLRRASLGFLAGLLTVLALPPFNIFAVPFLTFPVLVWLLDGTSGHPGHGPLRRALPAFALGWWFGFGYFLGSLWWLGNALLVEADTFAWALPLAVVGLPAVLAIYYGLAAFVARLIWSDGAGRIAALAVAFAGAEWLRGVLLTGFPWNAIGMAAMPVPLLMQSVSLVGMIGMNLLAVFVYAAPALIGTRKGMGIGLTLAFGLVAAHVGYGAYRLAQPAPPVAEPQPTVRIVQPAIDQSRKLDDRERASVFEAHLELSAASPVGDGKRPDIIVWPETAVPFILTDNPDALTRIADVLQDGQILITGAVRTEDAGAGLPPRYYNSVYVIDDRGQIIGAADKVHLVPFGEYLPFEELLSRMGLNAIAASMPGGFSSAATRTILTLPGGRTLYPLICYEAIFPNEIGSDALSTAALLNITNDAWFGDTPGPHQHFQQARLRAVENGLPMIRAANSGISAVIDARGNVVSGLSLGQRGFFDTILPARAALVAAPEQQRRHALVLVLFMMVSAILSRFGFVFRQN